MENKKITLNEGFVNLHNKMIAQVVETLWSMERIRPMDQTEFEEWQGKSAKKEKVEKALIKELKEREKNLEVINEIIKKYENKQ